MFLIVVTIIEKNILLVKIKTQPQNTSIRELEKSIAIYLFSNLF